MMNKRGTTILIISSVLRLMCNNSIHNYYNDHIKWNNCLMIYLRDLSSSIIGNKHNQSFKYRSISFPLHNFNFCAKTGY